MKAPLPLGDITTSVPALLETIQKEMFERAKKTYLERMKVVTEWDDVVPTLDNKNIVVIPWCEAEACEDDIKERSGRTYVSPFFFLKKIYFVLFFMITTRIYSNMFIFFFSWVIQC